MAAYVQCHNEDSGRRPHWQLTGSEVRRRRFADGSSTGGVLRANRPLRPQPPANGGSTSRIWPVRTRVWVPRTATSSSRKLHRRSTVASAPPCRPIAASRTASTVAVLGSAVLGSAVLCPAVLGSAVLGSAASPDSRPEGTATTATTVSDSSAAPAAALVAAKYLTVVVISAMGPGSTTDGTHRPVGLQEARIVDGVAWKLAPGGRPPGVRDLLVGGAAAQQRRRA